MQAETVLHFWHTEREALEFKLVLIDIQFGVIPNDFLSLYMALSTMIILHIIVKLNIFVYCITTTNFEMHLFKCKSNTFLEKSYSSFSVCL